MSHWMQIGGWTLIHFAWQGTVLTLAAAGMLRLSRSHSANTRYTIGCIALAAMLVAPVITACVQACAKTAATPRRDECAQ